MVDGDGQMGEGLSSRIYFPPRGAGWAAGLSGLVTASRHLVPRLVRRPAGHRLLRCAPRTENASSSTEGAPFYLSPPYVSAANTRA